MQRKSNMDNLRVIKLRDNIYGVKGIWLWRLSFFGTYSYIIKNKDGEILLIDTCGPATGSFIKRAIEDMGSKISDITGIALTHWHKDHSGSISEIISMRGNCDKEINIFIHKFDAPFLLSQNARIIKIHPFLKIPVVHSPGKIIKGCNIIELDHEQNENPLKKYGVDFIYAPGHTPGHTAYFHKESMSLFAGCGLSLIGENTVGIVPVFFDREKQIHSAMELASLEFKYLYPAHLKLRNDEIDKNNRIPFTGKISLIDRITGTLPIFSYPKI